ncbi:hypothetical protein MATL_G00205980 [Megalops atlanticus]|uniref:Uncharacterized protein n=1 Tax=Megalops atlanticus TaxID=7932 RepID=A0A9D3T504_MEGAT|nr:hypothetical protein MATL_G00205980 [Megalops atlanticus]
MWHRDKSSVDSSQFSKSKQHATTHELTDAIQLQRLMLVYFMCGHFPSSLCTLWKRGAEPNEVSFIVLTCIMALILKHELLLSCAK